MEAGLKALREGKKDLTGKDGNDEESYQLLRTADHQETPSTANGRAARKIIALYAQGNSYQDIRSYITDLYGISLSNHTLNAVTDKLIPELQAWRARGLATTYPTWLIVFA